MSHPCDPQTATGHALRSSLGDLVLPFFNLLICNLAGSIFDTRDCKRVTLMNVFGRVAFDADVG